MQRVELLGHERHYTRARFEAERKDDGFSLKTENVRSLRLAMPPGATREPTHVAIDGQSFTVRPQAARTGELFVFLERRAGGWASALADGWRSRRCARPGRRGLQGPIDDAFTGPFLCVRGTGTAWHEATERYARANLERFQEEWSRYATTCRSRTTLR
ncbi:MAG: hypothetical protein U0797_02020 [Gemmataceae bacterium]